MPVALMVGVDNRVTSATLDQPVVDGKSGGERDREGESQTGPEKKRVETGIHRAGNREHHPVVDQLHNRDQDRVGGERQLRRLAEGDTRGKWRPRG